MACTKNYDKKPLKSIPACRRPGSNLEVVCDWEYSPKGGEVSYWERMSVVSVILEIIEYRRAVSSFLSCVYSVPIW
jgi:hypothetical protein